MPTRGHRIERRNPPRSPYKNDQGECGVCGRRSFKFHLVIQRGVLVDRTHRGCLDTMPAYDRSNLVDGPHYGGS